MYAIASVILIPLRINNVSKLHDDVICIIVIICLFVIVLRICDLNNYTRYRNK